MRELWKPDERGASVEIGQAGFPAPFVSGLEYAPPARGTWNIVHIGMLVPESHQIFVCAQACLRGVVLTAAEMNAMDRFSTIAVEDHNLMDGDMEQLIIDGTTDILNRMPKKPRAVLLFTSCVHHFIGCDLEYVYHKLREKFPDVDFTDCYMNPIMRKSKMTPDSKMRMQLYSLLKKRDPMEKPASCQAYSPYHRYENRKVVNLIGNNERTKESSELVQMIRGAGYGIGDICACKTYEEYQELADSCLDITYNPAAVPAAKELEKRLGIPHLHLPLSFDYDKIDDNLRKLAGTLNTKLPDLEALRRRADEELGQTARELEGMPVAIDYTAVSRPLELAKLLITHGIRVEEIYADSFIEPERETFQWLQKEVPHMKLYATVQVKMGMLPHTKALENGGRLLAIGQKAAYYTGTRYLVNMVEGSGFWGYDGIIRLAQWMRDAAKEEADVENIIQVKGWGCCG